MLLPLAMSYAIATLYMWTQDWANICLEESRIKIVQDLLGFSIYRFTNLNYKFKISNYESGLITPRKTEITTKILLTHLADYMIHQPLSWDEGMPFANYHYSQLSRRNWMLALQAVWVSAQSTKINLMGPFFNYY